LLSGDVAVVGQKALRRHALHRGSSDSKSRRQAGTAYGGITNASGAATCRKSNCRPFVDQSLDWVQASGFQSLLDATRTHAAPGDHPRRLAKPKVAKSPMRKCRPGPGLAWLAVQEAKFSLLANNLQQSWRFEREPPKAI
jgi:hypothetical protein